MVDERRICEDENTLADLDENIYEVHDVLIKGS